MPLEELGPLSSLGIAGLLFVMWWFERQERIAAARGQDDAQRREKELAAISEQLLQVVQANTEAITALRSELRAQRASEAEWFTRLLQQVQRVERQIDRAQQVGKGTAA